MRCMWGACVAGARLLPGPASGPADPGGARTAALCMPEATARARLSGAMLACGRAESSEARTTSLGPRREHLSMPRRSACRRPRRASRAARTQCGAAAAARRRSATTASRACSATWRPSSSGQTLPPARACTTTRRVRRFTHAMPALPPRAAVYISKGSLGRLLSARIHKFACGSLRCSC